MKVDQLGDILVKQAGARKEGNAFLIPTDHEATFFVGLVGETLAVARVNRVEVVEPFVYADTARGERYVIAPEDVRALKIDKTESKDKKHGAGFGR
jgi:hypothetical protein